MSKLSEPDKILILSKLEEGWSIRAVARHYHLAKSTVQRVKSRWEHDETIARQQGSGRRKISTVEEDEALLNHFRENPFDVAREAILATNFPGSRATVHRRIKHSDLRNRSSAKKVLLTEEQKQARIIFCLNYVHRPRQFWNSVIFTDEKIFQSRNSGHLRVYRPDNCRFQERYVTSDNRSGRFSINVWAWMCVQGPGVAWRIEGRFNSQTYVRILEDIMLPSVTQLYGNNNFVYQQDNCPVHTAAIIREWFVNNNIELLPWPSRSPDINPIENVWGLLVKKIYRRDFFPQNANQLWEAVQESWEELSHDENLWLTLIGSMPRRLEKVLQANGAITKY